jgi:hypothetical protein
MLPHVPYNIYNIILMYFTELQLLKYDQDSCGSTSTEWIKLAPCDLVLSVLMTTCGIPF